MKIKYKTWRFRGINCWYITAIYYLWRIPIWIDQEPGVYGSYSSQADVEAEVKRLIELRKNESFIVSGKTFEA